MQEVGRRFVRDARSELTCSRFGATQRQASMRASSWLDPSIGAEKGYSVADELPRFASLARLLAPRRGVGACDGASLRAAEVGHWFICGFQPIKVREHEDVGSESVVGARDGR